MLKSIDKLFFYLYQADPETDEVYAQMTLQPVPTVRTYIKFS